MATLTSRQGEVADELTALEKNIQASHNNLALFGERIRWETLRDTAIAGGAGLAAGLLVALALRRPAPARGQVGG
jgi:hypothetical protein